MALTRGDVRFFKMSGGGNDFVAVLQPEFLNPKTVDALCARGLSLGADGAFSLERVGDTDEPTVRMNYYNANGSPANLCVNGARCAGLLAFHLGWGSEQVIIETGAGPIQASRMDGFRVALRLPPPSSSAAAVDIDHEDGPVSGWFIDTGVPHFVLEWPETLITAPVATLGADIRQAPLFEPAGTNVNFVRFLGAGKIEIRSFERGVEGETLACGTGVLAAAAVGVQLGQIDLPVTALTSGGFELEVSGSIEDSQIRDWSLAGDARLLGEGTLSEGALAIPEPPFWSP